MPSSSRTVTANFTLNTYTLSVNKAGTGSGTVTSAPAGINCGTDCSETYNYNTSVTLTATASTGSTFTEWSGAGCTGTCTVTMDAAKSVTATFTLNTYTLSVIKAGTGSGTVTSNPAGINCGTDCSETYNYNTSVTLTAAAATGSTFTRWSGSGCSGTGTCTVTMNAAKSVTATFTSLPPPSVPTLVFPANKALVTVYTPRLDWNASSVPAGTTFDYYQVQVATDAAFTLIVAEAEVDGVANSEFTPASDLTSNTTHYWHVRSYNTYGKFSAWSAVRTFRTAVLPPVLVSPANPTNLLYNLPTFNWEDVAGATGYNIQIAQNVGFSPIVANVTVSGGLNSQYTPTVALPPGTHLWWHVRANAVNGPSGWSETWELNTANPPSVPTLVAPANNALTTNYTPLLVWSNSTVPTGAPAFDHYRVQVDDNADFFSPALDQDVPGPATNSNYTPPDPLASNTKFYWRVSSYNEDEEYSAWSAVRTFRTALLPPTLLLPADDATITNRRPTFDWDDPAGATGYTLQISKNNTFTSLVGTYNVTASTYTPAVNLPVGTLFWRVRAKGPNGPSLWSAPRTVTVSLSGPD
jgi:hypothetical protein